MFYEDNALSLQQVVSPVSLCVTVRGYCWGGGGAKSYDSEKAWSSIHHPILPDCKFCKQTYVSEKLKGLTWCWEMFWRDRHHPQMSRCGRVRAVLRPERARWAWTRAVWCRSAGWPGALASPCPPGRSCSWAGGWPAGPGSASATWSAPKIWLVFFHNPIKKAFFAW